MIAARGPDFSDWVGRRVLITGGLDFIGSTQAHALVGAGADVSPVDSMNPAYGGNLFNLAGQTSHLDSMGDPFPDLDISAAAQLNLLEACRHHCPQARWVFASTRQIYGCPRSLPVGEAHPLDPAKRKRIDIGGYYADDRLLRRLTDWSPQVTLQDGLRRSIDYCRANLTHYL